MMFKGEDWKALQTLIDNGVITQEDQKMPIWVLDAIQTTIKIRNTWYYRDKILSNFRQQHEEGIHFLSTCIITLINNSKFTHQETKETLKIMLLQHAFRYHKAHNWIHQHDQQQLIYQALLSH